MNRTDLQILADMRVRDAQVLIDAGCWPAAFYLAGYAVECALKACAARRFREYEVPEKDFVQDFYTHRFEKLLHISGCNDAFYQRIGKDPKFNEYWTLLLDWNEAARYNRTKTETDARRMLEAVSDPAYGVLSWLKTMW